MFKYYVGKSEVDKDEYLSFLIEDALDNGCGEKDAKRVKRENEQDAKVNKENTFITCGGFELKVKYIKL